jgi:hypothetical protein
LTPPIQTFTGSMHDGVTGGQHMSTRSGPNLSNGFGGPSIQRCIRSDTLSEARRNCRSRFESCTCQADQSHFRVGLSALNRVVAMGCRVLGG